MKPDCDEKVGRACCRRHKSKDEDDDEDDDEDEDEHEDEHEQEEEGPGGTRYVSDMGIKPRAATSIAMDLGHIESLDISYTQEMLVRRLSPWGSRQTRLSKLWTWDQTGSPATAYAALAPL